MEKVCNAVRRYRLEKGWSQKELADRVSLSRQSLCSIEAGKMVASTGVALRLAQALGCRVDSLFWLEQEKRGMVEAQIGSALEIDDGASLEEENDLRVALAEVEGKWVAHPLSNRYWTAAAAGLLPVSEYRRWKNSKGRKLARIEMLEDVDDARHGLVVMGCAPALGLLAARFAQQHRVAGKLTWLSGASLAALDCLARGVVHLAGIHLQGESFQEDNHFFVRRHLPKRSMALLHFATWEEGWVVQRKNPLNIQGVEDLLRSEVRLVAREPGAGAHRLLERELTRCSLTWKNVRTCGYAARGHLEVAEAVAMNVADIGIAIRSAALVYGLEFIPLVSERFDLAFAEEGMKEPQMKRLIDTVNSRSFRRELESMGGYETRQTGELKTVSVGKDSVGNRGAFL